MIIKQSSENQWDISWQNQSSYTGHGDKSNLDQSFSN